MRVRCLYIVDRSVSLSPLHHCIQASLNIVSICLSLVPAVNHSFRNPQLLLLSPSFTPQAQSNLCHFHSRCSSLSTLSPSPSWQVAASLWRPIATSSPRLPSGTPTLWPGNSRTRPRSRRNPPSSLVIRARRHLVPATCSAGTRRSRGATTPTLANLAAAKDVSISPPALYSSKYSYYHRRRKMERKGRRLTKLTIFTTRCLP